MRNSAKVVKRLIVRYPERDLMDLRAFLGVFGAKKSITNATGICFTTIKRVSETGKGTVTVVSALKKYVSSLLTEGLIEIKHHES